jgi:tetratricopeptide (TPR) repeat protein
MQTRYRRGDLAGVEKHFARGSAFFDDPGLKEISSIVISYFGTASHNAWALGLSDVARERENHMMAAAAAKVSTPLEVAGSTYHAAQLRLYLREYRQAAALAARALELSDKHQLGLYGAVSKFILGEARAQLGHAAEGFRLIQRGVEDLLEAGSCLTVELATYLAAAQEHEDTIPHALATFEQALQANPDELVYRPEALRRRGELRVKQAQTELAQADFQEAVVLARRMGAKALELRASISLARLLAKQGRKDEGLLTLAVIYNWFTEGFDTVDLTEAKALFEELNNSA